MSRKTVSMIVLVLGVTFILAILFVTSNKEAPASTTVASETISLKEAYDVANNIKQIKTNKNSIASCTGVQSLSESIMNARQSGVSKVATMQHLDKASASNALAQTIFKEIIDAAYKEPVLNEGKEDVLAYEKSKVALGFGMQGLSICLLALDKE